MHLGAHRGIMRKLVQQTSGVDGVIRTPQKPYQHLHHASDALTTVSRQCKTLCMPTRPVTYYHLSSGLPAHLAIGCAGSEQAAARRGLQASEVGSVRAARKHLRRPCAV